MSTDAGHGFVSGKHSPEDLERFAALFVPVWEQAEVPASSVDPGFVAAAAPAAALLDTLGATAPLAIPTAPSPVVAAPPAEAVAAPASAASAPVAAGAEVAAPAAAPEKPAIKGTMMGIAAPVVLAPPPQEAITLPAAPAAKIAASDAPSLHKPPAPLPGPAPTVRLDVHALDLGDDVPVAKKRGAGVYVGIGVAVIAAGVAAFAITRAMDGEKASPSTKPSEAVIQTQTKAPAVDPASIATDSPAASTKPAAKSDDAPPAASTKPAAKADDAPKPAAKVDDTPKPPPVVATPKLPPVVATPKPPVGKPPTKPVTKIKDEF
jgi:hypothetical protein